LNDFCSDLELFLHQFDADKLTPLFMEHFKYGTADVYIENGKIVSAFMWDVLESGKVAKMKEMFLSDTNILNDSVRIIRYAGFKIKQRSPSVEYIKFDRLRRNPPKRNRVYKISSLIKTRG
jgi:hypothetical protein